MEIKIIDTNLWSISHRNWYKNKDDVILGQIFLKKERKLSYLSYKLLYTLSIEKNVDFVWIIY